MRRETNLRQPEPRLFRFARSTVLRPLRYGWLQVKSRRCETYAGIPLEHTLRRIGHLAVSEQNRPNPIGIFIAIVFACDC